MSMLTIDTSEVHALAADLRSGAARVEPLVEVVVSKTGHAVVATAQDLAPVDLGNLKNSIGVDLPGDMSFVAGPTVEYGGWVEEGTDGPYPIPNAFGWGITVMHPGNAPQPYMGPAFDRHLPSAVEAIGQVGERILQ